MMPRVAVIALICLLAGSTIETIRRLGDVQRQLTAHIQDTYSATRALGVINQIRSLNGQPFLLVTGDSIVDAAILPRELCGVPVVNAGISGSRAASLIPLVQDIAALRPTVVATVIAVGVNDAQSAYSTKFDESYTLLLDNLPTARKIAVASLAPVDFTGTVGQRFDAKKYLAIDTAIRTIAGARNLPLVNLANMEQWSTTDGIHPTIQSYPQWEDLISGALKRMACD